MRRKVLSFAMLAAGVVACLAGLSSCGDDPAPVPPLPTYCTWDVEQPSEPGQPTLTGVSAVEPGLVWAVGEGGTILFHDGVSWTQQPSGTANTLRGVRALGIDGVWAVGDGGTILFFDGTSWTPQPSGTTNTLRGVSALHPDHVWAVGDGGTILFFDGTSWTPQSSGTANTLRGVSALYPDHVWAVGDAGTILFLDGASWAPQPSGTAITLRGASAIDPLHVWAVGDGGTILFFDGASWAPQPSGTANALHGVAALDFNRVWAVGDSGTILYEHGSWSRETCDDTAALTDVSALATANGWGAVASGDMGLLLSKAQASLEGSVLNVNVNNYLSDPLSLSNARPPYCVNSYTLPQVPAGGVLVPGQATITADPRGSGFQCAFSDSDLYVGIHPDGGESIGVLRLNKFPGANWKVWVEEASPAYSISPSQTLKNHWSVNIKEVK